MMEEVDVEGLDAEEAGVEVAGAVGADAAVVSERRTVPDAKSFFLLVNHYHVGNCRLRDVSLISKN
jgi:hypothetical protein